MFRMLPGDKERTGSVWVTGTGGVVPHHGRERPGLGPVDHDLDEPQRLRIGSQPALRGTGLDVVPGDTLLVDLTGQAPSRTHAAQW